MLMQAPDTESGGLGIQDNDPPLLVDPNEAPCEVLELQDALELPVPDTSGSCGVAPLVFKPQDESEAVTRVLTTKPVSCPPNS
jgi:hypothetical protein